MMVCGYLNPCHQRCPSLIFEAKLLNSEKKTGTLLTTKWLSYLLLSANVVYVFIANGLNDSISNQLNILSE